MLRYYILLKVRIYSPLYNGTLHVNLTKWMVAVWEKRMKQGENQRRLYLKILFIYIHRIKFQIHLLYIHSYFHSHHDNINNTLIKLLINSHVLFH